MILLEYIPLNKYDTVIEHFDGSITIPPHEKKRYLFVSSPKDNTVFFLNNLSGSVFSYNLINKTLIQLNSISRKEWMNCIGIVFFENKLITYSPSKKSFLFYNIESHRFENEVLFDLCKVNAFTFHQSSCWIFDREDANLYHCNFFANLIHVTNKHKIKGIGNASITIYNDNIYLTDSEENLVRSYSMDGKLLFEAITPFIDPIGQFFYQNEHYILYGGLVNEVGYENRCWQEQKPFLHKIKISVEETSDYIITRTNTFEVDFFYEETFYENALHKQTPLTITLAIPPNTTHQKVIDIQPLGLPFKLIQKNNLPYALYEIPSEHTDVQSIGFIAKLQLQSIKYLPKNLNLDNTDLLSDAEKEDLEVQDKFFKHFILENEPSDYNKLLTLRNIIFDKLEYKKNTSAVDFKEVFQDGYGTCGDYTALMLIFFNINSISCQSASGYKIPRFYIATSGIYSIYYNHSWIEVYDKNATPLPLESSSDDKEYNQRFSEGQFLGLDWTHVKLYNGKAFPNLIEIINRKNLHPFDLFKKANVFAIVQREIL